MTLLSIEKTLDIRLTDAQLEYFDAIYWLLDDNIPITRAVGKSYLMAVVFIQIALKHPDQWIYVTDHVLMLRLFKTFMLEQIWSIIKRSPGDLKHRFKIHKTKVAIMYIAGAD